MSPCSRSSESLVYYTRPFIFPCSPVSIPNPILPVILLFILACIMQHCFFNNDITLNNDIKINDNYYFLEGSLEPPLSIAVDLSA